MLAPLAPPAKPRFAPPPGAVDAHCHVFGPAKVFPFAPERKYTPADAPKEQLFALRDFLGFARNVIVQGTCHGVDNRAMLDALGAAEGRARGVASLRLDATADEIEALHEAGVRAVRFNFVRRLVDAAAPEAHLPLTERIAARGWHVVAYFEASDLAWLARFLAELPATVVIDHMGRPDVGLGRDHEQWRSFVALMDANAHIWTKVSCPERVSLSGPPAYADVAPFAREIVERFPDRVLWGTDWPHPNMTDHMPDDGALVDVIPTIAATKDLQRRLLVDNPMRLYWPEEAR